MDGLSENGSLMHGKGDMAMLQQGMGQQRGTSVIHERQDSDRDLMALFETLVRPGQKNVVPMKERNLPQSFFTPRSTSAMSTNSGQSGGGTAMTTHSRENSMDSSVAELAAVRPMVGHHSRSFSAPAPSMYGSSSGGMLHQSQQQKHWPLKADASMEVSESPLPAGWEQKLTEQGEVFYVNHILQETTWKDPRTDPAYSERFGSPSSGMGRLVDQQQPQQHPQQLQRQQQTHQQQQQPFFTPTQDTLPMNEIMHTQQLSAPHPQQSVFGGETRRRSASLLDQRAIGHAGGRQGANMFAQHQQEISQLQKIRQQQLLEEAQRRSQKISQPVSSPSLMGSGSQSWQMQGGSASSGPMSSGGMIGGHVKDPSNDPGYRLNSPDLSAMNMQAVGRDGSQASMRSAYIPGTSSASRMPAMQGGYQPGQIGSAMMAEQRQAQAGQGSQGFLPQQQQQQPQQFMQQSRFGGSGYSTPSDMEGVMSGLGEQPMGGSSGIAMDLGSPAGNLNPMAANLDSKRYNMGYAGNQGSQQIPMTVENMMPQSGPMTFL